MSVITGENRDEKQSATPKKKKRFVIFEDRVICLLFSESRIQQTHNFW
jgi:hypothetical protein